MIILTFHFRSYQPVPVVKHPGDCVQQSLLDLQEKNTVNSNNNNNNNGCRISAFLMILMHDCGDKCNNSGRSFFEINVTTYDTVRSVEMLGDDLSPALSVLILTWCIFSPPFSKFRTAKGKNSALIPVARRRCPGNDPEYIKSCDWDCQHPGGLLVTN